MSRVTFLLSLEYLNIIIIILIFWDRVSLYNSLWLP